jgi:hypothetical protein
MPERIHANNEAQIPTKSLDRAQTSDMTSAHAPVLARSPTRDPSIPSPAGAALMPKEEGDRPRILDKNSLEYNVKVGLTGGLAGCVVSRLSDFG